MDGTGGSFDLEETDEQRVAREEEERRLLALPWDTLSAEIKQYLEACA